MTDTFKRILSRSSDPSVNHYLVIGIGAETFGVPTAQLQEIICLGDLETMPRLPPRFTGPVQVVGKLVSLVRLPVPFIRPRGECEVTSRTGILILKAHSAASPMIPKGVVVDRLDHIIELGEGDIHTVNTSHKGLWSECTLGFAGRHLPVVLIDLHRLITPKDELNGTSAFKNAELATSRLRKRTQRD